MTAAVWGAGSGRNSPSRVILADYSLANGIAGWWLSTEAGWELEKGQATASPQLGRKERAALRDIAKKSLNRENVSGTECSIDRNEEAGGDMAVQ
jgi:hypothetical protein